MASRTRTRAPRATSTPATPAPAPAPAPVITSIKADAAGFAMVADKLKATVTDSVTRHMIQQVESTCKPYECAFTGQVITPDWEAGFTQLCRIADTACAAGVLKADVLRSMYRLIGAGQEVKPRLVSETSVIKRNALAQGRNLAK